MLRRTCRRRLQKEALAKPPWRQGSSPSCSANSWTLMMQARQGNTTRQLVCLVCVCVCVCMLSKLSQGSGERVYAVPVCKLASFRISAALEFSFRSECARQTCFGKLGKLARLLLTSGTGARGRRVGECSAFIRQEDHACDVQGSLSCRPGPPEEEEGRQAAGREQG